MVRVGIVGGTGYAGVELLRLLAQHPGAEVSVITSRSEEGVAVADMYPNLRGHYDLAFVKPDVAVLAECDVVFFATPHGVAMHMMRDLMARGVRVIDISADFRLRDAAVWAQWYGEDHACPELLDEAVYGLPETQREAIARGRLIAVPGCYPTAIQLGLLPLLENGIIESEGIIASATSGASGAGRQAKVATLFGEVNDSLKAYGAGGHRHLPEIRQGLADAAGQEVDVTFVPHLSPMIRGIHASLYGRLKPGAGESLQALFEQRFDAEPFVDVMPAGAHPETRFVKGGNQCRLAVHRPQGGNTVVVLSVIDNLVKGASGQAVQAMNIMLGLPEQQGLAAPALLP